VITPLALVAWQERGNLPVARRQTGLADAARFARRSAGVGEPWPSEFGRVKFGLALPLLSHSGLQTLVRLAYAQRQRSTTLALAVAQVDHRV
jgi:hypothetical protein